MSKKSNDEGIRLAHLVVLDGEAQVVWPTYLES